MMKPPLISLCVFFYNHEHFVKDTLKSAFDQNYSNLEILISDDNSTDDTYEKIVEITNKYDGQHRININRNESNLGLCGSINRMVSLATGSYIVVLAGDDLALENRVTCIQSYLQSKDVDFVCTDYVEWDSVTNIENNRFNGGVNTTDVKKFLLSKYRFHGATESFSKNLFNIFGDLNPNNFIEDRALAFRAFLLKKVGYINEATVKYRLHSENLSASKNHVKSDSSTLSYFQSWYPAMGKLYQQHLNDLEIAYNKRFITLKLYHTLHRILKKMVIRNEIKYELDLFWVNGTNRTNIFSLCLNSVYNGIPLTFIGLRLYKKGRKIFS